MQVSDERSSHMQPIIVFDSGEGGLTVLRRAYELYPGEDYIYICDSAHFPYGTRDLGEIRQWFLAILEFSLTKNPKAVVIACNTATAAALDAAQAITPIPVIGVIEAGVRATAKATKTGRVGVLATLATVQSGIYRLALESMAEVHHVIERPCPRLVMLAEQGWTDADRCRTVVNSCVGSVLDEGIDTLVLGCTHFPHMETVFAEVVGQRATIIDPGYETAKSLSTQLERLSRTGLGRMQFFTTGDPSEVSRVARALWPQMVVAAQPLQWQDERVVAAT